MTNPRKAAEIYTHTHTHTGKFLLSLKQIGTICFIIFFPIISIADNITTSPANCNSTTLNTSTGPATLNADWEANEIQLRWYNNNTLMDSPGDNTCTYDETFATAGTSSTMTRPGYNFMGWRVRPEMDFSTIQINTNGDERWAKGRQSNGKDLCLHILGSGSAQSVSCGIHEFSDLMQHEWKVRFGTSYVYGMAKCSETSGISNQPGFPSETVGQNCWCEATGYKPSENDTSYAPSLKFSWVFRNTSSSTDGCFRDCANQCSSGFFGSYSFRNALFTPVSQ